MRKVKNGVSLSVLAGLLAASAPAAAQDGGLEEVIVTAQRRGAERLQDVPIAIGVVSEAFAREAFIRTLTDVGSYVPGVVPTSDTPGLRQGFFNIRGIGSNDPTLGANPSVAVFQDDVYIGHSRIANLSLYDIERVEVAKGPQGTLFGRNTIGGAIAVQSRRPGFGAAEVRGLLQATDYGERRIEAGAGGPVGEALALRLAGQATDGAGRVRELTSGRKVGYEDSAAFRASAAWTPAETVLVTVTGEYGASDGPGAASTNVLPLPGHRATDPLGPVAYDRFGDSEIRARSLSARVEAELGELTLSTVTAYRDDASAFAAEADYTVLNLVSQSVDVDLQQLSQEVRLTSGTGERLTWLAGASYYREKEREVLSITPGGDILRMFGAPVPSSLSETQTRRGRETIDSYAGFGEATYRLTPELRVTGGLRYTRDEVDQSVTTNRFAGPFRAIFGDGVYGATDGTVHRARTFSGWTPRLTLDWKPREDVMLYGSVTKGYKTGGFDPGRPTEEAFSPETVWSYEAGAKATLLDDRVVWNTAVFRYDYSNLISRALVDTAIRLYESSIEGEGLETELQASPLPWLRLAGNLTYQKIEYKDYRQGSLQLAGNRVPVPRLLSTLSAEIEQPLFGLIASLRAEHQYRGRSYAEPENIERLATDGYGLVNLRITLADPEGAWSLGLFGRNLLDRRFKIQHDLTLPNLIETVAYDRGAFWGADLSFRF